MRAAADMGRRRLRLGLPGDPLSGCAADLHPGRAAISAWHVCLQAARVAPRRGGVAAAYAVRRNSSANTSP